MKTSEVDVDGIQRRLGCGRFQFLVFFVLGLVYSRGAWHVFGIMFLAGDPGHQCALPRRHDLLTSPSSSSPLPASYNHSLQDSDVLSSSNGTGSYNGDRTSMENLPTTLDISPSRVHLVQGEGIDVTMANWTVDSCTVSYMTQNGSQRKLTKDCPYGWSYGSLFENTVVSEWNLVCGRTFLVELSITIFMVGATGGALLILPLADRWGRKRVMMGCLVCQACVGTATAFVQSYIAFTVLRFIIGMLNIGVGLCSYVLMTETFPAQKRTVTSIAFQAFWAVGVMTVAGFGYLLRDWRHLELLLSLPNLLILPCWWLLPESLPWLVSQKRWAEAVTTITTIAKFNRKDPTHITSLVPLLTTTPDTPPACCHADNTSTLSSTNQNAADQTSSDFDGVADNDVDTMIGGEGCANGVALRGSEKEVEAEISALYEEKDGESRNGGHAQGRDVRMCRSDGGERADQQASTSILDLFRYRRMCMYSCVMFFLFFVNSLGYFGISFSVPTLHGNQFVNLCIMGAVEIPANIICVLVSQRVGRRYPNASFLLLCGVSNIAAIFLPSHIEWLKLAFVMVGKFAITAAYSTIYLYSAEIFPTSIRNQAMGMSSVFENIGSISAPFMVLAAKTVPEAPLVVFGVLTVGGACLTLLLPETHNRPLPQTVHEITTW